MKTFFKSAIRIAGYIAAAFILLYPVLIGVTHLLSPKVEARRAEIEKWASDLTGMPVTIDKVKLSWYILEPKVDLQGVTIFQKDSHQPVLQIKKVSVMFSIPKSLWERAPVPGGIAVAGSEINVLQNAAGDLTIQGFPSLGGDKPFENETRFTDVLGWLSVQPHLVLRDIDIHYTGFTGQKRFVTLYKLGFKNDGDQHHIVGKAVLRQAMPTDVNVSVHWEGDPTNLPNITVKAYLAVSGVSLMQWAQDSTWQGWQIKEGVGSARCWLTWEKGALRQVQSKFQLYGLKLYSQTDKSIHPVNRFSGDIGWKREGNQQVIAGEDMLLDLPKHLWPVTNFYVSLTQDAQGQWAPTIINLGYLDFRDVQKFLLASPPLLSDEAKKNLTAMQLRGSLQNTHVVFNGPWQDWQKLSIDTTFNHVGFLPIASLPRVTNLSGQLKWSAAQGSVTLNGNRSTFAFDSVFNNPIKADSLTGNITWQQNNKKEWVVRLTALQFLNPDLSAIINGSLTLPAKGSPLADLQANFALQHARHAVLYLPMKAFSKDLADWLKQAFLSGEITAAKAELKGPLEDFPFDKGNSTFLATGTANNIDLRYAPDWPILQQVNAKLTFSGRRMDIELDHARMLDVPIGRAHAEMQDLGADKPQIIQVTTEPITADFNQALNIVNASPLKDTIGKMLSNLTISNTTKVKLKLILPLEHLDQTQVIGDLGLKEAVVNLMPWNLILKNVTGDLRFTEKGMEAKSLHGTLFDKPLNLKLTTVDQSKTQSFVRADFSTLLAVEDLEKWLKLPLSPTAKGETKVKGQIDFSLKTPIVVRLNSDLVGLSLALQDQYGKKAEQPRHFAAEITAAEKQPLRLKAWYGDLLGAALVLDRKNDQFSLQAANLQLGKGNPDWPKNPGIYITGQFPQLDWNKIKSYLDQAGGTSMDGLKLSGVDVQIDSFTLFGQHLTQAHVQLDADEDHWDVAINSQEVDGEIQVPVNFSPRSQMTAHFQRLTLKTSTAAQSANSTIDLKTLPAILLTADYLGYNDMAMGRVVLKTTPSANGLTIQSLRVNSPYIDLQAGGATKQSAAGFATTLQGTSKSEDFSGFLGNLGLDVHNFIAKKAEINFNLNWHDAFFAPNLATMNGHVAMKLGAGRIADIGESSNAKMGIGRLLSIFSLQTIPRRLSLDFSDVFQKGYSFDTIKGDFSLKNGNAYTNNMRIDGPVAKVSINGRFGLKQQDYDFTLSVTPYVTSSLPLVATLLSGPFWPATGLAAMAVNSVLGPQISKAIATYTYAVRGPWSNPVWEPIKAPTPQR